MRRILASIGVLVWAQVAMADAPRVVTDIAPVHSLVAMVMGDLGEPVLLLPQGADPHDFQLRPSQASDIDAADLVIWIGPEMSPWLARATESLGRNGGLALLDAPETLTQSYGAEAEGEEHDLHADEHGHDGVNPHAWLEPENARIWLGLIAEALAGADPQDAAVYRANAVAAQAQVTQVEAEVVAVLAPVKHLPFGVLHDAYGYFTAHFGVQVAGSLRMGDAALPGAAHIAEMQEELRKTGAVCLFPEANHDTQALAQMAEATGLRLGGPLDPEGTMLPPGPALYGDLMRGLATTLAECLAR